MRHEPCGKQILVIIYVNPKETIRKQLMKHFQKFQHVQPGTVASCIILTQQSIKPRCENSGFLTRFDTNQPEQPQKIARSLTFRIEEQERLYSPSSENKDTDQLCSYCTADLHLCFRIGENLVFSLCGSIKVLQQSH